MLRRMRRLANNRRMATSSTSVFVPKVGRPSAKQVAAIHRAIMTTAREMFLENGYDAVAMEVVAAAAGVSKGTLYARYASKELLFHAVVEDSVENWSQESGTEDHLLTDDLASRLHHHARTIARSLVKPDVRAFSRLVAANAERFPIVARSMYDIGYLHIVRLLVRDIEAAAVRDAIPVRDADGIARHLVSVVTGWHMQESGKEEVTLDSLERFASRAVDLLMAARPIW